jgi:diacylglycerol kinase family enzyme
VDAADDPILTETEKSVASDTPTFEIEVWADNGMAVYIDGELIGEDSVSITTAHSRTVSPSTLSPCVQPSVVRMWRARPRC